MRKGNIGKRRDAAVGGHAARGAANGDRCDSCDKPRSHDTLRIAWAKLMTRIEEEFPLECPGCGGDILLIAFVMEPGPIWKIPTRIGSLLATRSDSKKRAARFPQAALFPTHQPLPSPRPTRRPIAA